MPNPTPGPAVPMEYVSAFDVWQFAVDVASTVATLGLALAAFLVSVRAHRLNELAQARAVETAAREERWAFSTALDAYRTEIMNNWAAPMKKRQASAQYAPLAATALARGTHFRTLLQAWRQLEVETQGAPRTEEVSDALANAVARLVGATARWVNDPATVMPEPVKLNIERTPEGDA